MSLNNKIQIRRGSSSEWANSLNILASGEMGYDTTLRNLKVGNNTDYWEDLPWLPVIGVSGQIINPSEVIANTGIFDLVELNTATEIAPTEGQVTWNSTYGTLDLGFTDTYSLHIGQETHFRVRNETGGVLYKGQCVYATGVHNDNVRLEIDKYTADGSIVEVRFIGLVSEDISDNGSGYTTSFGYIRGNATYALDTRGNVVSPIAAGDETWAQGDILYVHPTVAGKLTKVEPKHSISVALVVRVHQTDGVILVRPTSYGHLEDNHDVTYSGLVDNNLLVWNSGSDTWEPSSSLYYVNGDLGINQPSPSYKLEVNGTFSVEESARFRSTINAENLGSGVDNTVLILDSSSNIRTDEIDSRVWGSTLVDGAGSAGHVAYWTDANTLSYDSSQLYWDSSNNRLGIGTNAPLVSLDVRGTTYTQYLNLTSSTVSRILATDVNKTVTALNTATYPDLTELSYLKGVTSSIQTQINSKVDGSGTSNYISKWSDSDTLTNSVIYDNGTNVGIGNSSPTSQLHVVGTGNFTGDLIVGGNFTVLGTTVTADVDRMEVEDPIITLGLASGNIVTDTNLDRGLALALNNGLTAFMGWDTSENEFSLLSSGVAQNSSGNYIPGTYGDLHIGGLTATTANFSSTVDAANLGAGEDNSVVILDSDGKLRTDEIDSRVWGSNLVDGTGLSNHVAFWSDTNTLTYDTNQLVWDSSNDRLGIGIAAPSGTLHVVGEAHVDNLKLDGNTLSSINTNGNVIITPNGTGGIAGGANATVTGSYGVVGGGYINTASAYNSTVSGGACNTACGSSSTVSGGYFNTASGSYSTMGGGFANTASASASTVSGGTNNTACGCGSTVSGGYLNIASARNSSISGGCKNFVNARHGSINGGHLNIIQSPTNECCSRGATIGGGIGHNTTGGTVNATTGDITETVTCCNAGAFSTISGGLRNIATGACSAVSGGGYNCATGNLSIVGGGGFNSASGTISSIFGGFNNFVNARHGSINGGYYNIIQSPTNECCSRGATIGGGVGHNTTGGTVNATTGDITGAVTCCNAGAFSTIGGGFRNRASGNYSTVSGGYCNKSTACYSSTLSGYYNSVTGDYSVISGGNFNSITSENSTISGGYDNISTGNYSSISGGCCNNDGGYANVHILGSNITATQADTTYTQNIIANGHLSATTKSFLINHPTRKGHKLQYGSLESPYHGIRLTGKDKLKNGICIVQLPDYISKLVHEKDINIQITNYNHSKTLYVNKIDVVNNHFIVKTDSWYNRSDLEFFWTFTAIRKDVNKLIVEFYE